ncbi:Cupin [Durusdinium trenchii]|uniref:Cupin n=1 Tax=Durusdinium trenchii TaxID=1381693 RepID=A0ABP0LL24_9DINO
MKINAEFDKRVVVHSEDLEWIASPMAGVFRRPLDRVGGEVARATTIVKYDAGSHFSPHVHTGGEEFIVLDGVFQDEHGDFPVGSYIRNPPQSSHTPGSEPGCVIFVKLWQFDMEDRTHVRLNMNHMGPVPHKNFDGVSVTPLYTDDYEEVSLFTLEPNAILTLDTENGAELLVLEGEAEESGDALKKHSWLRTPQGGNINARAGANGARLWIKTGHMNRVHAEAERALNAS